MVSDEGKRIKDKIVEISWVDSFHDSDWLGRAYARKSSGISTCKTVGYLLKSNFREVTVFASKSEGNNHITDTMSIPRGAIRSIRHLE